MIKSKLLKKISGLPAEEVEQKKKGNTKKFNPYPVPEEDNFTAPDDDSTEVKYITKKNKAKL
jgi:hypothetical protein